MGEALVATAEAANVAITAKPEAEPKKSIEEKLEERKFSNPVTVHQHYVNNLVDSASNFYDTRKDVPLEERSDFFDLLLTVAREEKVSTVDRNTFIVARELAQSLDGILEKMGAEPTKQSFAKYAATQIPNYTELVTVKDLGLEKEFSEIIIGSFNKAVDDVSAKKSQQVTKEVSSVPATANAAELAASAELNR